MKQIKTYKKFKIEIDQTKRMKQIHDEIKNP